LVKAGKVVLVGRETISSGYVTVVIRGEVSMVDAAAEAGAKVGQRFGE
jgi:ethanolamine utilization protein EutM